MSKTRNYVAKNINKFNKPVTHVDKKKEVKIKGPDILLDELEIGYKNKILNLTYTEENTND